MAPGFVTRARQGTTATVLHALLVMHRVTKMSGWSSTAKKGLNHRIVSVIHVWTVTVTASALTGPAFVMHAPQSIIEWAISAWHALRPVLRPSGRL